jgi:DNA invertase Pin-like site-specific DNA recombinase
MIKAALAGSCPDCRRDGDRVHTREAAGGDRGCQEAGSVQGRRVMFDHGRIVSFRKQGIGATEIARKIGCSRGAVYKVLGTK